MIYGGEDAARPLRCLGGFQGAMIYGGEDAAR
eukprot:SAG11_NODE_3661_length_2302_cov_1.768044_4_plen_31_part_01